MAYNRHYCYRIDFEDGFTYFGVRSCGCDPAEDTSYMGSPKTHKAKWLTDITRVKTIVSEYDTRELAEIAEDSLIRDFWAVSKLLSLNAKMRGAKFHTLSVKHAGRQLTAEHREKIGAANSRRLVTAETRAKMSEAAIGRVHTEESRAKMSAVHAGRQWYTNGIDNALLSSGSIVPEGFVLGRSKFIAEACARMSESKRDRKWFTDGATNIQLRPSDTIPAGFSPGMTIRAKQVLTNIH